MALESNHLNLGWFMVLNLWKFFLPPKSYVEQSTEILQILTPPSSISLFLFLKCYFPCFWLDEILQLLSVSNFKMKTKKWLTKMKTSWIFLTKSKEKIPCSPIFLNDLKFWLIWKEKTLVKPEHTRFQISKHYNARCSWFFTTACNIQPPTLACFAWYSFWIRSYTQNQAML